MAGLVGLQPCCPIVSILILPRMNLPLKLFACPRLKNCILRACVLTTTLSMVSETCANMDVKSNVAVVPSGGLSPDDTIACDEMMPTDESNAICR